MMTQAISCTNVSGFASELAALQLENEANQTESARIQRDAARQNYLDQTQQQVDALHAAAEAMGAGAMLSASLTIASSACQIGSASCQFEADVDATQGSSVAEDKLAATILGDIGSASAKLADPLKTMIGDSTAEHYQAEVKRHEMLAAQAQWQAGDASTEIDKANKQGDKMLDLVQELQQNQDAATNALIGRI